MSAIIQVEGLRKSFTRRGQTSLAIDRIDLAIEEGSFVTIAGPSGCGKSTMLSIVAGLETPTSGNVLYRGQPVREPRMDVGYLTQKDTLMPWRNIIHNVEMPLEIRGANPAERRRRAETLIQLVGLKGFDRHYPRELSGGMLRRASLARMLTADPETLLLDEPFGALDAQLRLELQNELLSLWSGSNKTVLFVTHDIEEAIVLGDRAIVLGVPGHIVCDVPITLPRPRDAATIRFTPEFAAIHQQLHAALRQGRAQSGGEAWT